MDQLQDEAENKPANVLALDRHHILCRCPKGQDVQGNACLALVAIVKPTPENAAKMLSAGVVGLIKRAMEATPGPSSQNHQSRLYRNHRPCQPSSWT